MKRKWVKRMFAVGIAIIAVLVAAVFVFMQQAKFGRHARGARLEKIRQSPYYKNGAFQNAEHTPMTTEGVSSFTMLGKFLFGDKSKRTPPAAIPSVKRDLKNLAASRDALVWFGHSSYYIQTGGKRILVDPVFSGAASPIEFTTKSFKGADAYTADDMPRIDYLIITHDHWDHLDHRTVLKLKPNIGKIICPLGVGEHLEHWGFEPARILEMQWGDSVSPEPGVTVHCLTARHFSGRGFARNRSLWAAFFVETPALRFYIGGDSGYGAHFAAHGKRFGRIDLAILENGQYDPHWKYIHMMPEDVLRAAADLNARRLLAVHNSKFSIANHDWNDPLRRLAGGKKSEGLRLLTPVIGEIVDIRDDTHVFSQWWEKLHAPQEAK